MKLTEFKSRLEAHPEAQVAVVLPDGSRIPRHYHVTEIGHVAKKFIDCGGTFRTSESCVLQTWVAAERDDGHRLAASKLAHILGLAHSILPDGNLPVEVEYEAGVVAQFPVEEISIQNSGLTVRLGYKHTDCLARERCNVPGAEAEAACCAATESGGKGCCG